MPIPNSDFFQMLQQPIMMLQPAFHSLMLEQVLGKSMDSEEESVNNEDIYSKGVGKLSDEAKINVVYTVDDINVKNNSVAYHPIYGVVSYNPRWWGFSTKEFIGRIQLAEENPSIIAHFIHVDSPGGVAYGMDVASEVIKKAKKPIVAFVEGLACSAGYFLIANADYIYSASKFDTIGSIGTMITLMDIQPYWEKLGLKIQDIYADPSTLKNDTFNQAYKGKHEKIKEQCLNPLAEDFIDTVKSARKKATDENIYKGETYFSTLAKENGLIDGIKTKGEALRKAFDLGIKNVKRNNILTNF